MLDMTMTEKKRKSPPDVGLFSETNVTEKRRAAAWLGDRLEKSRNLHASELISEVVTLTPAMAELILSTCNKGNRTLRPKRVAAYADAIRDGRWKLSSQGISLSRDGRLNNGQHRLNAIIEAGRPVQMMVVFGEDRAVFDVIDNGAIRGGSDTLHVAGYKNTKTLAAAARLYVIVTGDQPNGNPSLANDQIKAVIEDHPRLEDWSTSGHRVGAKLKCSTAATTTAFYLIGEQSEYNRRLEFFIDRLLDGASLRRGDPILTLRDGLTRRELEVARDGTGKNVHVCAAIILAWNRWVRGRTASMSKLRWSNTDPFPQPE